jgi:hypothetical protein
MNFQESDEKRILRRAIAAYASVAEINTEVTKAELTLALHELQRFDAWAVLEEKRKKEEYERQQKEAEDDDKWRDSLGYSGWRRNY